MYHPSTSVTQEVMISLDADKVSDRIKWDLYTLKQYGFRNFFFLD